MKILSRKVTAKKRQLISVHVDRSAIVKFFTPMQFEKYKKGLTHHYWGGFTEEMPAIFEVPQKGSYFAVVELGTYNNPIALTARVEVKPPQFSYLNVEEQNETRHQLETEYDDTLE